MRCGIIVIVLLSLLATTALSTSPPEMVPLGHPCYDSLVYLLDKEVLPGIYEDLFSENKPLSFWQVEGCSSLVKQVVLSGRPDSVTEEDWRSIRFHSQYLENEFGHNLEIHSVYEDIHKGHWSYDALDYLSRTSFLEEYPKGFFNSERIRTRYEFAQAVAHLLDSMGGEIDDGVAIILAEALREEYKDQLKEMYEVWLEQEPDVRDRLRNH